MNLRRQIILFAIVLQYVKSGSMETGASKETLSQNERLMYGSLMASYIDQKVDPCEDFQRYACGNFFKVNKESSVGGRSGSIFMLNENLLNTIHEMLSEPVNASDSEKDVTVKVRAYYQSCIKANLYPYKKSEHHERIIESLGGWPVLNSEWKAEKFDWFNTICELKSHGISAIISERQYEKNSSEISLDDIGLFSLQQYLHQPYSRAYRKNKEVANYIMKMYGVPKAKAEKAFKEIVQLGKSLVDIRKKIELIGEDDYEDMSLEELSDFMPEQNWTKFYSVAYKDADLKSLKISVVPGILKKLPSIFDRKNLRAAANYFILVLLFNFHSELQHKQDHKSYCIRTVKKFMNPVISAMFLESKYHDKHIEDEILAMASYIRAAFRDSIQSAKWIDKESRRGALLSLQGIDIEIGDSEFTLDMDKLNEIYSDLGVSLQNDFWQNNANAHKFTNSYNPSDDDTYSIEVNAYYSPWDNKLILPGGIFRRPFYYPELPKPYNFGAIGSILAHEFSHSMDGSQLGRDWWNDESSEQFIERAMCFSKQYSAYKVDAMDRNLQGNKTIQDDIADNSGIRLSFYGYKKWLTANRGSLDMSKQVLPGLNMTDTQLFFLSFAQLWCESVKGFAAHKKLFKDVHSPGRWRIIGTLSNFDEFSKAFDCKLGSNMNPEKKCILW